MDEHVFSLLTYVLLKSEMDSTVAQVNKLKTETITGTTDASGNITVDKLR